MKSIQALWLSVACALVLMSTPVVIGQDADSVKSTPVPLKATYPDLVPSPIQAVAEEYKPVASSAAGQQFYLSPTAAMASSGMPTPVNQSTVVGETLHIQVKLAEVDFIEPERIGVDWDLNIIGSESKLSAETEALRISIGKLDSQRPEKVLNDLVHAHYATVISTPQIAVLSGTTARIQIGSISRSDKKEAEVADKFTPTPIAGIGLTFEPKLRDNSVFMSTRIESIPIPIVHDDSIEWSKREPNVIEFATSYELGEYYAIRTEPWNQGQPESGKCYYMILKVDRLEAKIDPLGQTRPTGQSETVQAAAVAATALASARQSNSVDANRLSANPSLSAVPPKIDSDSSKVSLSAIQDEVSLLRKDVARLIQLLESRK